MEQNLQAQFSEIDLLTGCWNLVSFTKGIQSNFGNGDLGPMTLIGIDVNQLRCVNGQHGCERGDQLLRWLGIALRDEMGNSVYRIAWETFVIVLVGGSTEAHHSFTDGLDCGAGTLVNTFTLRPPIPFMFLAIFTSYQAIVNTVRALSEKPTCYRLSIPFLE